MLTHRLTRSGGLRKVCTSGHSFNHGASGCLGSALSAPYLSCSTKDLTDSFMWDDIHSNLGHSLAAAILLIEWSALNPVSARPVSTGKIAGSPNR